MRWLGSRIAQGSNAAWLASLRPGPSARGLPPGRSQAAANHSERRDLEAASWWLIAHGSEQGSASPSVSITNERTTRPPTPRQLQIGRVSARPRPDQVAERSDCRFDVGVAGRGDLLMRVLVKPRPLQRHDPVRCWRLARRGGGRCKLWDRPEWICPAAAEVALGNRMTARSQARIEPSVWLPNEWRISCEGARGSRRATSQQYQARRLPPQERALASCMRWLGSVLAPLCRASLPARFRSRVPVVATGESLSQIASSLK